MKKLPLYALVFSVVCVVAFRATSQNATLGATVRKTPVVNIVQTGHNLSYYASIEAMQFSPDGRWLASSVGGDLTTVGQLLIWNDKAQIYAREDSLSPVQALDWSSDSRYIAIGDNQGAKIWSREEMRFIATTTWPNDDPVAYNGVQKIQFLDENRVAVVQGDNSKKHKQSWQIWNWKSGDKTVLSSQMLSDEQFTIGVRALQSSPDGKTLALSAVKSVELFDVATGKIRSIQRILDDSSGGTRAVVVPDDLQFSPDGKWLVGFLRDNRYAIFDVRNATLKGVRSIAGFEAPIAYRVDNAAQIVWMMRQERGKTFLETFRNGQKVSSVRRGVSGLGASWERKIAFDAPNKRFVIAGEWGDLSWFNVQSGKPFAFSRGATQWANAVSFPPDGGRVVVGYGSRRAVGESSESSGELAVFDAQGVFERGLVAHRDNSASDSGVNDALFSPDGRFLVSTCDLDDGSAGVRIFDAKTYKRLTDIALPEERACKMAFSPNGKKLAVGTHGGDVLLWDMNRALAKHDADWTFQAAKAEGDNMALILSIAFSHDGKTLWAGADGGKLVSLNSDGQLLHAIDNKATVNGIAFSVDGRSAWTGDDNGAIVERNMNLQVRRTLQKDGAFCGDVAISPDEKQLFVVAENKVVAFDLMNEAVREIGVSPQRINAMALSPDGQRIASADEMGTTQLYEVDSGKRVSVFHRVRWNRDKRGFLTTRTVAEHADGRIVTSPGGNDLIYQRVGEKMLAIETP